MLRENRELLPPANFLAFLTLRLPRTSNNERQFNNPGPWYSCNGQVNGRLKVVNHETFQEFLRLTR
jgi:hypothetical protein